MTDSIEICFPDDQQEGTEATVARWLVAAGDRVAAHQPVVEIETDKVVVEIAAPQAGQVIEILIGQDQAVNPGDVLARLDGRAAASHPPDLHHDTEPGTVPAPAPDTAGASMAVDNTRLSPAVRQRVMQHQLDISSLKGSGRGGRITLQDVEALLTQNIADKKQHATPATAPSAASAPTTPTSERIPHNKMRKRIAANMVASLMHTAPHVTSVFEADLSAVMRHRTANKAAFANRGTALTLTVYFVAAAIAALQKVPRVNSRWHTDYLEIFQHINMGIGTALGDAGLIVPVLHNAQNMDLDEIAAGLADLTQRAREGTLKPRDVRAGTFTISNHGVAGSLIAAPIIINQPQSAILGVGKIEKRTKIIEVDGEDVIAIRPMCYVSLTIDHRVVDGFQTNAFLSELVSYLENWA